MECLGPRTALKRAAPVCSCWYGGMDLVIAGMMAVKEAALEQVRLTRRTGLIDGDGQIVVTLPIRASHSGDYVAVATPDIGPTALALEHVHARRGHMKWIIPALAGEDRSRESRNHRPSQQS
jgi:hypothetical protein